MDGRWSRKPFRFNVHAYKLPASAGMRFLVGVLAIGMSLFIFWQLCAPSSGREVVSSELTFPKEPSVMDSCKGRWIFVHNISSVFNMDLVADCKNLRQKTDPRNANFCPCMENDGMGRGFEFGADDGGPSLNQSDSKVWFRTWQFSLELYFFQRLKTYPCLTSSEEEASAFFVPFFTGLDLMRRISHRLPRNKLHLDLLEWLKTEPAWQRNRGLDHFLVLGRIGSDFRRADGSAWGNQMMFHADWQKMVKLTIERTTSKTAQFDNELAVPYPSYFHPFTDSQIEDVVSWLLQSSQRSSLASFAGKGRPERIGDSVRRQVIHQCESDPRCTNVVCGDDGAAKRITKLRSGFEGKTLQASCGDPSLLLSVFHRSQFCLQPPGDSPTRRSFFDSMLAGCIPVIFNKNSAWTQYISHLPEDGEGYSVFIPMDRVKKENVLSILEGIPAPVVDAMRARIAELIPRTLYAHVRRLYPASPGSEQGQFMRAKDAFDLALDAVLHKVEGNRRRAAG